MKTEDITKLENLISLLSNQYGEVVSIGESPYQENLKALREIDIRSDYKKGRNSIKKVLSGIDSLVDELETLSDGSEKIGNITTSIIRSS
jgi:hypothetical protein